MKPSKQLFRHNPAEGTIGDCFRTAIACLLDLDPQEVPHFVEDCWQDETGKAGKKANAWLKENHGLRLFEYPLMTDDVQRALECVSVWSPNCYYLLAGTSPRGTNHVTVAHHDKIVHDPAIDGGGLIGPCDDGMFWISVTIPTGIHEGEVKC